MELGPIARALVLFAACAIHVACSDSADLLSAAEAREEAPTATVALGSPALGIPAATGTWWTYSVEGPEANHRSVHRVELAEELAPGHFAIRVSVLAANGSSDPVFPYVSWRFGSAFSGTTRGGQEITFFTTGRRWAGPGLAGHFAATDELAPTSATESRPTWKVEATHGGALRTPGPASEERYTAGVGFLSHAFSDCSGTRCISSTIKLVAWSFTQPSSVADRRCRDDLSGAYDNGVSLTQQGTTVTGSFDLGVGASGSRGAIRGTRTATSVSLRYDGGYAVDYIIHRTGLTLTPTTPAEPMLLRTCAVGEL